MSMQRPVLRVQGVPLTGHPADRLPTHTSIPLCAPWWGPHLCRRVSCRDHGEVHRVLREHLPTAGPSLPSEHVRWAGAQAALRVSTDADEN